MTKLTFSKNQGFFLKKSLLDKVETSFLQRTPKSNTDLQQKSHTGKDKDNRNVLLAIWTNPGVSVYGTIARIKSVVDSMEKILGGRIYTILDFEMHLSPQAFLVLHHFQDLAEYVLVEKESLLFLPLSLDKTLQLSSYLRTT